MRLALGLEPVIGMRIAGRAVARRVDEVDRGLEARDQAVVAS